MAPEWAAGGGLPYAMSERPTVLQARAPRQSSLSSPHGCIQRGHVAVHPPAVLSFPVHQAMEIPMRKILPVLAVPVVLLSCSAAAQMADIPEPVRVPSGHTMSMKALGVGELTYECKAKPADATAFEWVFVGPIAKLMDTTTNKEVGRYYAGPTWESTDGSKITGKQVAIAPAAAGNIPLQLVKTEPAMGSGAMTGVTYIQRVNTKGGVAPADPCAATSAGMKKQVPYQAVYVFYRM
jgi:hypothetical protein